MDSPRTVLVSKVTRILLVCLLCSLVSVQGKGYSVTFDPSSLTVPIKSTYDVNMRITATDPNATAPIYGNITIRSQRPFIAEVTAVNTSVLLMHEPNVLFTVQGNTLGTVYLDIKIDWGFSPWGEPNKDWDNVTVFTTYETYEVEVSREYNKKVIDQVLMLIVLIASLATLGVAGYTIADWQWDVLADKLVYLCLGVLLCVIIVPLLALGMVELFNFVPGVKMGILAAAVCPPALSSVPVAVILEADVLLVFVTMLCSLTLSMASLPIWMLRFRFWDHDLKLLPRDVPFVLILFILILGTVSFGSGIYYRGTKANYTATAKKLVVYFSFANLIMMIIVQMVYVRDLLALISGPVAICSSVVPVTVLLVAVLLILFTDLDPGAVKAMAILLLVKGSVIAIALLNSVRLADPYVDLAYASACFYAFMTLLITLVVCVCYRCYRDNVSPEMRTHGQQLLDETHGDPIAPSSGMGMNDCADIEMTSVDDQVQTIRPNAGVGGPARYGAADQFAASSTSNPWALL